MRLHLDLACVKLNDAEEKIECLQRRFDEKIVFVWKINDFREILRQAKSEEENIKIESDPFFTESYGYKLKVTIFANGTDSGENTHLSVSIVVMKGEYDAILPWPFKKKVKFTLIDQQEDPVERENVSIQLIPGDNPENFARPVSEENVGRGFAQFISHNKLNSRRYLVDDTLFLKVEIFPSSS